MDKQEAYLKKLHENLLIIMDEIDRICTNNGIRYYLGGGSLIGAIRHHGFIPWDDDMDINMPYEDFKRFIEIAPNELGEKFYLRWITTEKHYIQDFAKVAMKGTLFQERDTTDMEHSGIFVDIFPIYPSFCHKRELVFKKRITKFLHVCLYTKGTNSKYRGLRDLPRIILSNLLSSNLIYKLMLAVIKPVEEGKATHYACYPSLYPIIRQVCPKDWCGEGIRLPFEDRKYICPKEPYKKLALEYGDNFMQLPPLEKRKIHYPLKVTFADGQSMTFQRCDNEVCYEDVLN